MYFMSRLRELIDLVEDLVFISDRYNNITNALFAFFLETSHEAYSHR